MAKAAPVMNDDAGEQPLHHSMNSLHSEASTSTACSCGCVPETTGGSSTPLGATGVTTISEAASPPTSNALQYQLRLCCGGGPDSNCSRCRSRNGASGNNDGGNSSARQGECDNRRPADNETTNGESPRSRRTTIRLGPRRGPFIALYMPRTELRRHSHGVTKAFFRAMSLTFSELMPWMMGLVVIYYAFKVWGLGPGFSAFLLMMGIHACLRWRKAQSSRDPICLVSRLQRRSQQHQVWQEAGERRPAAQGEENEEDRVGGGGAEDSVEPPPYDMVMTKPPPYNLLFNSQPESYLEPFPKGAYDIGAPSNTSPLFPEAKTLSDDGTTEEDAFLPSYSDAVVIAARQNR